MNKVILTGRMGNDPELKQTKSDKLVCSFSLATNGFSNGEKTTEWHKIVAWEKTADIIGKYAGKGSLLGIEGRLQTRSYDKDGEKRFVTEIVASNVELLGGKKEESKQQEIPNYAPTFDQNEEIPF